MPGGEGKITIHLKTKNKGGQTLSKTIKVRSNDPSKAMLKLTIKGPVKKFADMSTTYISFRGALGKNMERKFTITPKKEFPFKIKNVQVKTKSKLDVVWKEIKTDSGTGIQYEFLVKNTQTGPGSCKNAISINIDSKLKRQLVIYVGGYLSAPVKKPKKK